MATISIPNPAAILQPFTRPITQRVNAYWRPQVVKAPREHVPVAMRGTPEIYFHKPIDNSRLVRVIDPRRTREMMQFSAACAVLFLIAVMYVWQHFSAIEYGYHIEAAHAQIQSLGEEKNQLQLEQAALRDPQRIDQLARQMGMLAPQVGQVVGLDPQVEQPAAQLARANSASATVAP